MRLFWEKSNPSERKGEEEERASTRDIHEEEDSFSSNKNKIRSLKSKINSLKGSKKVKEAKNNRASRRVEMETLYGGGSKGYDGDVLRKNVDNPIAMRCSSVVDESNDIESPRAMEYMYAEKESVLGLGGG